MSDVVIIIYTMCIKNQIQDHCDNLKLHWENTNKNLIRGRLNFSKGVRKKNLQSLLQKRFFGHFSAENCIRGIFWSLSVHICALLPLNPSRVGEYHPRYNGRQWG